MFPIIGRLGPLTLYAYGLALALAFVAGYLWMRYECGRRGFGKDAATDLVLAAAIGGVVGARIAYILAHFAYFAAHPIDMIKLQQGGLVFYGGVAGGVAAVALVVRMRKLPLGITADMAAPALALGSAIGRIGCFCNGCCYGRLTKLPFGITFPAPLGGPRFPTQFLDSGYNLLIFAVLVFISRKYTAKPGFIFWFYLCVYSAARFGVEFLRENPVLVAGFSGAQLISLGLFAMALGVLVVKYRSPLVRED